MNEPEPGPVPDKLNQARAWARSRIYFRFISTYCTLQKTLLFLLFLKACLLTFVIFHAGIGLGPDEAQYWTWSQLLDFGYYSKPPGIAWQIWLGTKLFGQTEWGVRSFSVFLSFFQGWAIYRLALGAALRPHTAFWCALMMAFSPLGVLGSFFAITDVGFLLCWTLSCIVVISSLSKNKEANPILVGFWILLGSLFKWPIYLFWIFFFLARHWYFPQQKIKKVCAGVVLSLLGLFPSLFWNESHNWATFRHVLATAQGGSGHKAAGNVGEFLGAQAALLFPILFILLLIAGWRWFQQRKTLSSPLYFSGMVTWSSLGLAVALACIQKVQGNWVLFAYPTAFLLIGWSSFEADPKMSKWIKISVGLSVLVAIALFLIPSFSSLPYKINPLKHNLGWNALSQGLAKEGYNPKKEFLMADTYQTASILSFYSPGQQRSYFLNILRFRQNQFSYWPPFYKEKPGEMGYFVRIESGPHIEQDWKKKAPFYQGELEKYFGRVVPPHHLIPLIYEGSSVVKGALIFRCYDSKNTQPVDPERY